MTKTEIRNVLIEMLSTYCKYRAEMLYWVAQENCPIDEKMRERASRYANEIYSDLLQEIHEVRDAFDQKYEDTDDEEIAYSIDFEKVVKEVDKKASAVAETMRQANGIFIK